MTNTRFPHIANTHPEFDQDLIPENLPTEWIEDSWRNDLCPKFTIDETIIVFLSDEDPADQITYCIYPFWNSEEPFETTDFVIACKVVEIYREALRNGFGRFQKTRTVVDDMESPYCDGTIKANVYGQTGLLISFEGDGKYGLVIENMDWVDSDLEKLEWKLFLWAVDGGRENLVKWPSNDDVRKAVA